jgi:hypothetical protein
MNNTEPVVDLANDMNACISDAMDALARGDLAEVRSNLRAMADTVREIIDGSEEPSS